MRAPNKIPNNISKTTIGIFLEDKLFKNGKMSTSHLAEWAIINISILMGISFSSRK
jgi:hypothetical protein